MNIFDQVKNYTPVNEQEENDRKLILRALEEMPDVFERSNEVCHMTASCWITDSSFERVLMAYHKIYDSWAWLGGHCDGEKDLLAVALKEAREESGIEEVVPLMSDPISLEILTVDGHEKKGRYVSSHLHLNLTYLLQADEGKMLHIKEDENSAVKWFALDEAVSMSSEPWFRERIYPKLNEKLRKFALENHR